MYFAATSESLRHIAFLFQGHILTLRFQALYVYDYLLTFDREVKYFWNTRQTFGTILFYFYRYPALANTVLEVMSRMDASWQSAEVCGHVPYFLISGLDNSSIYFIHLEVSPGVTRLQRKLQTYSSGIVSAAGSCNGSRWG